MNDTYETQERPLLDSLIESRELTILKTMVPYMHEDQQKKMAMIIKLIEFQKTAALFESGSADQMQELHACGAQSDTERYSQMLTAIRGYCTPKEQETIDTVLSFFEMSASYGAMFGDFS